MRHYEGLFILDTVATTESVDDIIKAIGKLIGTAGGKVLGELETGSPWVCPDSG